MMFFSVGRLDERNTVVGWPADNAVHLRTFPTKTTRRAMTAGSVMKIGRSCCNLDMRTISRTICLSKRWALTTPLAPSNGDVVGVLGTALWSSLRTLRVCSLGCLKSALLSLSGDNMPRTLSKCGKPSPEVPHLITIYCLNNHNWCRYQAFFV